MAIGNEIATLSTEAQNYIAKLEADAKSIWAHGELYVVAGVCLLVGLLVGHFFHV
jgi:hypothetical protein